MADIEIILTSPATTIKSLAFPQRRLSLPVILKPAQGRRLSVEGPQRRPTSLSYHLHTLFLFTRSDIKDILLPQTFLSLVTAVSCSRSLSGFDPTISLLALSRLPLALAWVWLHVLLSACSDQSQPSIRLGDSISKSWRPLPSKRLTPTQARLVLYATAGLSILLSLSVGGTGESLAVMLLTALSDELLFGKSSVAARAGLNVCRSMMFSLGAVQVLLQGTGLSPGRQDYLWLTLLAAVILTTGDCRDLEVRGVAGTKEPSIFPPHWTDEAVRYSVVLSMLGWTIFVPRFWKASFSVTMMVFAIGAVVIRRLAQEDKVAHRPTVWLWRCWIVALYVLPLLAKQ